MAKVGRSWPALALALALIGGAWWGARWSPQHEAPRPLPEAPVEPPVEPVEAPTPVPTTRSHLPPPVSASAPAGCPEDAPEDPRFVRPSVWELLRLRVQELRDRLPQLSRDASPELRAGLEGLGDDPDALERLRAAPDRMRDGFDVAVAAELHAGMRALGQRELSAAREHAARALEDAPDDPLAHALLAIAADEQDEPAAAREALAEAYALASDEPAIALAHARAQAEAARFERALEAANAYLEAEPGDARLESWRDRMAARDALTRGHVRSSSGGVDLLVAEGAVPRSRLDRVREIIRATLAEVARRTGHPRRAELAVVVYADRAAMRRATCTPEWTGAVYDGVLHLDAGTLARAEVFERVVRHEATHAQLARIRGAIPHWLNEGFAQWMEGPPSQRARSSWRRMTERRFWIPFASLEGGLLVIDDPSDAELAYHQSLAMVRYLVHYRGEDALGDAIARVERGETQDLLQALVPATGEDLIAFLRAELGR